ncbi:hypothetical protein R6Q57_008907 [Mikania cordata]
MGYMTSGTGLMITPVNCMDDSCGKVKYDGYLVEKYGDECSNHPKYDEVLWSRAAGGKNKRKVYGLSCINDLNALENEKLNEIIKEIMKEKE